MLMTHTLIGLSDQKQAREQETIDNASHYFKTIVARVLLMHFRYLQLPSYTQVLASHVWSCVFAFSSDYTNCG